jgi:type I restriction enzyme M protein
LKDIPTTTALATVIGDVFVDSFNYMKNGQLLRQVINKINEGIDFNSSEDRHLFGDIYEKLLKDLQSAGNAGEFYTPRAVTEFMVDRIDPKLGEKVFDPACGTGGFLANTINHVRKNYVQQPEDESTLQATIAGIEKKQLPHVLCVTNMLLHGIDTPSQIKHDNTLARPLRDYSPKDKVDCIVTNPPFGGVEEDGIESNFPKEFQTRETADLFLLLVIELLNDGGRCGIVLPNGTLFGDGVKERLKQKLLEECNLHTIVRLPRTVFAPYTTTATNILFFVKGVPTKEVWYYEHHLPVGYKAYSKTKPMKFAEFKPEQEWWENRKESERAWKVPVEEIVANNYNLDIKNPNVVEDVLRDPVEILEDYQNLDSDITEITTQLKELLKESLG